MIHSVQTDSCIDIDVPEDMENLWTATFKRFIASPQHDKKLKVLQKVILLKFGDRCHVQEATVRMSEIMNASNVSTQTLDASSAEDFSPTVGKSEDESEFEIKLNVEKPSRSRNECDLQEAPTPNANNNKSPVRSKIIKVKIVVPNGVKKNRSVIETNVVSVFNDISKSPLKKEDRNLNVNEEQEENNPQPKINKRTGIYGKLFPRTKHEQTTNNSPRRRSKQPLRSPDSAANRKSFPDFEEDKIQKLVNRSGNYPPLMGQNALITRSSRPKNQNDAEIVRKIVTESFNDFYSGYYQRSYRRASLRQKRYGERNNYDVLRDACENLTITTDLDDKKKCCEYDANVFLKNALGDDLDDSSTQNLSTCSTVSKTLSTSDDHSVGTSEISALVSKNSLLYNSMTKKFRRLCSSTPVSSAAAQCPIYEEVPERRSDTTVARMEALMGDAARQYQVMLQTSKALRFCKKTKEFACGVEQVEAERILLVAAAKRELLLKEIRKLEYDDNTQDDVDAAKPKNSGSVTISRLKFRRKDDDVAALSSRHRDCGATEQRFVCLLKCGATVLSTEAVPANDAGDGVHFNEEFTFEHLLPGFEIKLELYAMKLKNKTKNYSHDDKFHLNKSPMKKIFSLRRLPPPKSSRFAEKKESSLLLTSSFSMRAWRGFNVFDLSQNPPFRLSSPECSSSLSGGGGGGGGDHVDMAMTSELKLSEVYAGFLTIGSESGGCATWTRRWCSLYCSSNINFWNYPSEENETEPIGSFDLRCCVASWVGLADREICPRPRTLLLETGRMQEPEDSNMCLASSHIISRHFLSADTLGEMKLWEKKINAVVASLRHWRSMKCQILFN